MFFWLKGKKVKDKQQKTISNAFSTKKVPYSGNFLSFEMLLTKIYMICINFQKNTPSRKLRANGNGKRFFPFWSIFNFKRHNQGPSEKGLSEKCFTIITKALQSCLTIILQRKSMLLFNISNIWPYTYYGVDKRKQRKKTLERNLDFRNRK